MLYLTLNDKDYRLSPNTVEMQFEGRWKPATANTALWVTGILLHEWKRRKDGGYALYGARLYEYPTLAVYYTQEGMRVVKRQAQAEPITAIPETAGVKRATLLNYGHEVRLFIQEWVDGFNQIVNEYEAAVLTQSTPNRIKELARRGKLRARNRIGAWFINRSDLAAVKRGWAKHRLPEDYSRSAEWRRRYKRRRSPVARPTRGT